LGFADGVDNETAYAASMPLTTSGTSFRPARQNGGASEPEAGSVRR
jgi:hypothetical protein